MSKVLHLKETGTWSTKAPVVRFIAVRRKFTWRWHKFYRRDIWMMVWLQVRRKTKEETLSPQKYIRWPVWNMMSSSSWRHIGSVQSLFIVWLFPVITPQRDKKVILYRGRSKTKKKNMEKTLNKELLVCGVHPDTVGFFTFGAQEDCRKKKSSEEEKAEPGGLFIFSSPVDRC